MRILHVSLGLPPYRTGGLTKYSFDLMKHQQIEHEIMLLYPGHYSCSKDFKISADGIKHGIEVYELINPFPVPLLDGIRDPQYITRDINMEIYLKFLNNIRPDIIHLHSLMGIHQEFLSAARHLNIKTVFTSHDYFGICPRVNLFNYQQQICTDFNNGQGCVDCNRESYGFISTLIRQSTFFKLIKNKIGFLAPVTEPVLRRIYTRNSVQNREDLILAFEKLRNYYLDMHKMIDHFHYNSLTTKEEYNRYFNAPGEVINICHSKINDNRRIKNFGHDNDILKITYLGSAKPYKGLPLLMETLQFLLNNGKDGWRLKIYGAVSKKDKSYNSQYITFNGKYSYDQLENIFNHTDILIIPSLWKETFGFVGLEALSYGVPVVVSKNVGFKDLISDRKTGFIFEPTMIELAKLIKLIISNRKVLEEVNNNIVRLDPGYFSPVNHFRKIAKLYLNIIKEE